jgi:hypothetical protein
LIVTEWHIGCRYIKAKANNFSGGIEQVRTKLTVGVCALALALTAACGGDTTNSNANANSTNATTNTNTRVSTDVPISTTPEYEAVVTEEAGVKTETRTYPNNARIQKVVITTRAGKRTAVVYNARGEKKELAANDLDTVLAKTGDGIADAAGFVGDKAEDVAGKAKDVGRDIADKGEDVAGKAADGAKTVGDKAVDGAKTAGKKTVEGAKKVGGAIKDAVTP